jgi:hypothetical protein
MSSQDYEDPLYRSLVINQGSRFSKDFTLTFEDEHAKIYKLSNPALLAEENPETRKTEVESKPDTNDSQARPFRNGLVLTASANDSQSNLAKRAVLAIHKEHRLTWSQAGKLHDLLLHEMGYSDSVPVGKRYVFKENQILNLVKRSAVSSHETAFWRNYAKQLGF